MNEDENQNDEDEILVLGDTTTERDPYDEKTKSKIKGRKRRLSLIQNPISPETQKYATLDTPDKHNIYELYDKGIMAQQEKRKSLLARATKYVQQRGADGCK